MYLYVYNFQNINIFFTVGINSKRNKFFSKYYLWEFLDIGKF